MRLTGLGVRAVRTAAARPAALSLSLVPAAALEEATLCAADGRARVRPRQAHLAGPAGAVACMALLARLRASRRLPRRHAGADRVLRQRQLRAPEGDHAVAAAERAAGGDPAARCRSGLRPPETCVVAGAASLSGSTLSGNRRQSTGTAPGHTRDHVRRLAPPPACPRDSFRPSPPSAP